MQHNIKSLHNDAKLYSFYHLPFLCCENTERACAFARKCFFLLCFSRLMEKHPETNMVTVSEEYSDRFYHDGSLRGDVPSTALRSNWNVKYVVVSQVNVVDWQHSHFIADSSSTCFYANVLGKSSCVSIS